MSTDDRFVTSNHQAKIIAARIIVPASKDSPEKFAERMAARQLEAGCKDTGATVYPIRPCYIPGPAGIPFLGDIS